MAAQNIAMQCFVKLCTQFGSLLLVRFTCHVGLCIQLHTNVLKFEV